MKFPYKIHSGYDGFRPAVLPKRMHDGKLRLGWRHYIDVVEKGWECWIYFHGPHRFENGVYAEGIVADIDLDASEVMLRVLRYDTSAPIRSAETSRQVAQVVKATRFRQVFLWRKELTVECGLSACRRRECDDCQTWNQLPLIEREHARPPPRLQWSVYDDVVPAHWIEPRRCYAGGIAPMVKRITRRFTDFKLGEMGYAYPFARAMFEQLRKRELIDFDYVVPIPLSPGKADKGEKHRTRFLAKELGRLLGVSTREMLGLSRSISKRSMQSCGHTTAKFEMKYRKALVVNDLPNDTRKVLLVDDVMTRGSTAAQALGAIRERNPEIRVVVATAGQMIVKAVVVDKSGFISGSSPDHVGW